MSNATQMDIPSDGQPENKAINSPVKHKISGTDLQSVEIILQKGQSVLSESSKMNWMDEAVMVNMATGGIQGMLSRNFAGESMLLNKFTAEEDNQSVSFAPNLPGKVVVIEVGKELKEVICKKGAFLAAEQGIETHFFIARSFAAGAMGGNGFVQQKFDGKGKLFVEAAGEVVEYNLKSGQSLDVDQGIMIAYESTINYELKMMKGLKNMMFGGEGLFLTSVQGPGKVWLQTSNKGQLKKAIQRKLSPGVTIIMNFLMIAIFVGMAALFITLSL